MVRTVLVLGCAAVVATAAAPAGAAEACWKRIVRDWSADTTVDGRYPVSCYRKAIANLPIDLQIYSSAPADIEAALQERVVAQPRAARRPADASGSTRGIRRVVLPLVIVGVGVVLLLGFLMLLGVATRHGGSIRRALSARSRWPSS